MNANLICRVKTNIVTAVEIRDRHAAHTKSLPDLLDMTAEIFRLREISADKAYSTYANYDFAERHGATPFIAFRTGSVPGRGPALWEKMFLHFQLQREDFLARYHKRSNVESTFWMIKAKFRDDLRSKPQTAMVNEVPCKIICHNICVLAQEAEECGIAVEF